MLNVFVCLYAQPLQRLIPAESLRIMQKTQYLIHNTQFHEADSLLSASECPLEIKNFLNQVSYFWRFTYTKNDSFAFLSIRYGLLNKDRLKDSKSAVDSFFLGGTCGYLGLVYASMEDGSTRKAMSEGGDGYHILSDLLKKNPDLSECYLGVGIYRGMVSKVPAFLRWILYPFGIKGDFESAMESLDKASKTELTKADAWFWKAALLKEGAAAASLCDSLTIRYPQNPLYHFMYGNLLYKNADYEKALTELNTAEYQSDQSDYLVIKEGSLMKLGHLYYDLKQFEKSISCWHQLEDDRHLTASQQKETYRYLLLNYKTLHDTVNIEKYSGLYENN
jgi:tetratricopeptide (TPR) repeat protein